MVPSTLIIDLQPDPCPDLKCKELPSLIRKSFGEDISIVKTTKFQNVKQCYPSPKLILIRPSPRIHLDQVLRDIKVGNETVPMLALYCAWRPNSKEVARYLGHGLDDYLMCPFEAVDVMPRLERLIQKRQASNTLVIPNVKPRSPSEIMVGESEPFRQVLERIPLFAKSNATVLISGETGTGKDLVARAIHYQSARHGGPFIPLNCGALPSHLCENELFGHAKGAFTDANCAEKGMIAEAEGGTLFLDEIGAMPLSLQAKFLRFLQTGEYRPLGSSKALIANVRILSATNSTLKELVEKKQFREDLFYRLHILHFEIPPLRDRVEDISVLAHHFLRYYGRLQNKTELKFSSEAMEQLLVQPWPGNVRELEGVVHRGVTLSSSSVLQLEDLDLLPASELNDGYVCSMRQAKHEVLEKFERTYLVTLMSTYQGNVSRAAKAAGKERRSFQRLLQKHHLERTVFLPDPIL